MRRLGLALLALAACAALTPSPSIGAGIYQVGLCITVTHGEDVSDATLVDTHALTAAIAAGTVHILSVIGGCPPAPAPAPTVAPVAAPPVPQPVAPPASATIGTGTYLVPSQVAPGTYAATAVSAFCVWQRLSGFGGSVGEVIAGGIEAGQSVVTILSTDKGFTSTGCGPWTRIR